APPPPTPSRCPPSSTPSATCTPNSRSAPTSGSPWPGVSASSSSPTPSPCPPPTTRSPNEVTPAGILWGTAPGHRTAATCHRRRAHNKHGQQQPTLLPGPDPGLLGWGSWPHPEGQLLARPRWLCPSGCLLYVVPPGWRVRPGPRYRWRGGRLGPG